MHRYSITFLLIPLLVVNIHVELPTNSIPRYIVLNHLTQLGANITPLLLMKTGAYGKMIFYFAGV